MHVPAAPVKLPEVRRPIAAWAVIALLVTAAAALVAGGGRYLSTGVTALAETGSGTLVVSSHPPGARVVVDGTDSGVTPVALLLPAGPHAVVLSNAAGRSEQLSAEVIVGTSVSRHVLLEPAAGSSTLGAIAIEAATAGARVVVDRVPAGTAPLTVSDLAPGEHVVQLTTASGTTERRVSVTAGATTRLVVEAPPPAALSGWIAFSLPFDVQVFEDSTFVGSNRGDRIRVGAGRHTFDLVSDQLGYRSSHTVVVTPGRTSTLGVEAHTATLSVNAQPWAEVFIGERSYGETPLADIALPIGVHDVTLRHPSLGERVVPVTVRLGTPNRLSLDLRK